MDEIRDETEYEQGERLARELKYRKDFGITPASMRKGSDLAPVFWLAFFAVTFVVLFYFGSNGG